MTATGSLPGNPGSGILGGVESSAEASSMETEKKCDRESFLFCIHETKSGFLYFITVHMSENNPLGSGTILIIMFYLLPQPLRGQGGVLP